MKLFLVIILLNTITVIAQEEIKSKIELEPISISATKFTATIFEFDEEQHLLVANLVEPTQINLNDIYIGYFEDSTKCNFKVVRIIDDNKVFLASTQECPYENKIKVGLEIKKSLIKSNTLKPEKEKITSENNNSQSIIADWPPKAIKKFYIAGKLLYSKTDYQGHSENALAGGISFGAFFIRLILLN